MRPVRSVATPSDAPARVAGVILAAGTSSRLGRPKQLLDICGEPLVRGVARIALASRLDTVTVVIGNAADQVAPLLDDLDVTVAFNGSYGSGQASSLKAGVRAVPANADAVLLLLVDQPTVEPATINAVIEGFEGSQAAIVQARYEGAVPGHPVLFRRELIPELQAVEGDEGGRGIIRRHRHAVRYVEFDREVPPDIDTDADYRRVLSILSPPSEHDQKL